MRREEDVGTGGAASPHRLERPLGTSEGIFHAFNAAGAFVTAQAALVEGPLTLPLLSAALAHLQQRHPALRARIEGAPGAARFVTPTAPCAPPLRVVSQEELALLGPRFAERLAESALHAPYDVAAAPLWRLAWAHTGPDAHLLVLGLHHAIADGLSAYRLVLDLLAALEALARGAPLPGPLPAPPALEAVLPLAPSLLTPLRHRARNVLARLRTAPAGLLAPDFVAPAEVRRTRLQFRALGAETLSALHARARAERTTVNGALTAALLSAVAETCPDAPPRLSFSTQVSLRGACVPEVDAASVGCFASNVRALHPLPGARADFWALARRASGQVHGALARGDCHEALRASRGCEAKLAEAIARDVADAATLGRSCALSLSNRGRLAPHHGRRFALRGYYSSAANHPTGNCLQLSCGTLNGELLVTLAHVAPLTSEARARQVLDALFETLEREGAPAPRQRD